LQRRKIFRVPNFHDIFLRNKSDLQKKPLAFGKIRAGGFFALLRFF